MCLRYIWMNCVRTHTLNYKITARNFTLLLPLTPGILRPHGPLPRTCMLWNTPPPVLLLLQKVSNKSPKRSAMHGRRLWCPRCPRATITPLIKGIARFANFVKKNVSWIFSSNTSRYFTNKQFNLRGSCAAAGVKLVRSVAQGSRKCRGYFAIKTGNSVAVTRKRPRNASGSTLLRPIIQSTRRQHRYYVVKNIFRLCFMWTRII